MKSLPLGQHENAKDKRLDYKAMSKPRICCFNNNKVNLYIFNPIIKGYLKALYKEENKHRNNNNGIEAKEFIVFSC